MRLRRAQLPVQVETSDWAFCRLLATWRPITGIMSNKRWENLTPELLEALLVLTYMWDQYCAEQTHRFMVAGEQASRVLSEYGILSEGAICGECDQDFLDFAESQVWGDCEGGSSVG